MGGDEFLTTTRTRSSSVVVVVVILSVTILEPVSQAFVMKILATASTGRNQFLIDKVDETNGTGLDVSCYSSFIIIVAVVVRSRS